MVDRIEKMLNVGFGDMDVSTSQDVLHPADSFARGFSPSKCVTAIAESKRRTELPGQYGLKDAGLGRRDGDGPLGTIGFG
jgi:hypothetical protein